MEQHPIPQNISSYQFRLVGDMTLKQFFQIAGGALISLLVYSSGLHPVLKWPLILISFGLGAALAFVPFQERPLEQWILAFFRSVYSPTHFLWKQPSTQPVYFQPEPAESLPPQPEIKIKAKPYEAFPFLSNLEEAEENLLKKITRLFSAAPPLAAVQIRPSPQTSAKPEELTVPVTHPVSIPQQAFQPRVVVQETSSTSPGQTFTPIQTAAVGQTIAGSINPTLEAAQFSLSAAPPMPPTQPNIIVGQTLDPSGRIAESVILEIRDDAGRPVRALKSNKAGHFMIVTPLLNGNYEILAEKDGVEFEPVSVVLNGTIVPPIILRARNTQTTN